MAMRQGPKVALVLGRRILQLSNRWKVLITTPATLAVRHGPSQISEGRMQKYGWSVAKVSKMKHENDPKWEQNLSGLFEFVIIDEAHSVKNSSSNAHTACRWLRPEFYILSTATPDINSVRNVAGYVPFVQPRDSHITTPDGLADLGVDLDTNPYEFDDDDHPGRILQTTEAFFSRFVTTTDITNQAVIGQRLRKFYRNCVTRQSYVSTVDGKRIGDDIPMLKHQGAICEFTSEELA